MLCYLVRNILVKPVNTNLKITVICTFSINGWSLLLCLSCTEKFPTYSSIFTLNEILTFIFQKIAVMKIAFIYSNIVLNLVSSLNTLSFETFLHMKKDVFILLYFDISKLSTPNMHVRRGSVK